MAFSGQIAASLLVKLGIIEPVFGLTREARLRGWEYLDLAIATLISTISTSVALVSVVSLLVATIVVAGVSGSCLGPSVVLGFLKGFGLVVIVLGSLLLLIATAVSVSFAVLVLSFRRVLVVDRLLR